MVNRSSEIGAFEQIRRFPATYGSMADILAFTTRAAQSAGFDANAAYDVQLAVCEACGNIIKHGYGGEGLGEIAYICSIYEQTLTVILRDTAPPFDMNRVPPRNPEDRARQLTPGGWGLFFIRHFMDEIKYHQEAESTNVLVMTKNHKGEKE